MPVQPRSTRYTPPGYSNDTHRQVSWLPDHCSLPAFPPVLMEPAVACGQIAPRSQLRGQQRLRGMPPPLSLFRACMDRPPVTYPAHRLRRTGRQGFDGRGPSAVLTGF